MRMKNLKVTMFVVCVALQVVHGCLPKEREALLQFKAAIVNSSSMLSFWTTPHCCQWEGIRCSDLTAHILGLDLSSRYMSGEIHKSLMELPQLQYLNLSFNSFRYKRIPEFIGSLTNLRYLDLSSSAFGGKIPSQFSSLSHLKYLNLAQNSLEGSIPRQLGNLSRLQYLDLRYNSLEGNLPSALGNISQLQHLDLRYNYFEGNIPSQLGNLSQLQELYLGGYYHTLKIDNGGQWLSNLISLSHLSFQSISNFNSSPSLLPIIAKLPKLRELSLMNCGLSNHSLLSFMNTCTLHSLDMSGNNMSGDLSSIFRSLSSGCVRYSLQELILTSNKITGSLPDLSVFSSLKALDLSNNQLSGKIPEGTRLPSRIQRLSISANSLEGGVPKSFGSTCTLESLDLVQNKLSGDLTVIFNHLSGCSRYSLQHSDLSMNEISGTLSNSLLAFTSLKSLYLDSNKLNGTISKDLRFQTELEELSLRSNSLKGVITDSHFYNMSKLKALVLSDNLLAVEFSQTWTPSFQLDYIGLRSCKLGPLFPKWLENQNEFSSLDISNNEISDNVPNWFWVTFELRDLFFIDISCNNLQGKIPNLSLENHLFSLNLGSNQFEGPIPLFLGGSLYLDLSNNKFADSFLFLCSSDIVGTLYQLDLSNNQFSRQIPDCWTHFKSLVYLNMSQNNFSGKIPTSMGSLIELQVLLLRNNNLTGEISFSLRNCTKLVMLDMAENRLSGPIPYWIGSKLLKLQFLSLGNNYLNGSLPLQICYIKSIQLLDLSLNNLSGQIPKCIKNFSSMTQVTSLRDYQGHWYLVNTSNIKGNLSYNLNAFLTWKGSEQMFTNNGLSLLRSIDLSSNQFSGEIPKEVEDLVELISLNLSRNHLMGKIPSNIGKLTTLEFLDLSRNHLIGSIPSSLAQIDRLTVLDLSHNYLSGHIPSGTQLQSFDTTKYEGNVDLCGLPLKKLCIDRVPRQEPLFKFHEDDNLIINTEFYISMTIGFVISFLGIFGSILISRSWRHAYFKGLSDLKDTLYIMIARKVFK